MGFVILNFKSELDFSVQPMFYLKLSTFKLIEKNNEKLIICDTNNIKLFAENQESHKYSPLKEFKLNDLLEEILKT